MEIEELKNDGLMREYKVTVDREEVDRRINLILMDVRDKVRLKGFRPGKAPLSLLKRMHGDYALGQAVEESVKENTDKLFRDRGIRPAMQPRISVGDVEAESGFDFTVEAEILPEIDASGFKAPELTRLVAKPSDEDVHAAIERLAAQSKRFEHAAEAYKAKTGDAVTVDFTGTVDGESFEGGSGEGVQIELGANQFFDDFERELVGVKAGDKKSIDVAFPETDTRKQIAGKTVRFDVTVKEVRKPAAPKIDDELAKSFGVASLDQLKEAVKSQLDAEAQQLSRAQIKRQLLDELAAQYDFAVPPGMVDLEYRDIWNQIKRDAVLSGEVSEDEVADKEEPDSEEERKDYRDIAERRVRLGLLLSELGLANNIEISRDELMRKVVEEARKYPGQEQQVYEFYTKNEQAMAQLRAPVYEDKVVDFILEMADVEEKSVSLEDLRKAVQEADTDADSASESKTSAKSKAKSKAGGAKKASSAKGKPKAKSAKAGATKAKAKAKSASSSSKSAAKRQTGARKRKAADKDAAGG